MPRSFNTAGNLDKMKQVILKHVSSEAVEKEVGKVEHFKEWLNVFSLEDIPQEALAELFQLVEGAEDKNKMALVDLLRLLMQYEGPTAHAVYAHWETIDTCIF